MHTGARVAAPAGPGEVLVTSTMRDLVAGSGIEFMTRAFGMEVQFRSDQFAVVVDPGSGLKLELSTSADGEVHLRHLGFRADDVHAAHESLVAAGMETTAAPHRRDFSRMYTSFLSQPGGLEVQLVRYD